MSGIFNKALMVHLGLIVVLLALHFILPAYHHVSLARIMVLAVYALGFNLLFGYTGLLSLGHALFFAAGLYGAGLSMQFFQWTAGPGFVFGLFCAIAVATLIGMLALRTVGVSFMIVTMMFAQVGYLLILYYNEYTRGDEGFVILRELRVLGPLDLSAEDIRYLVALALLAAAILIKLALVRSPTGRILIAIRENEERTRMLGYDPFRYKLMAMVISGAFAGAAGAAYGILFGYVGASFASIQYSILPLLYVLMGGAGVVLGPLLGTIAMFYLIDIASGMTSAYLFFVGLALVFLILVAPKGLLGTVRERWAPWLP
ncbi:MAG: branched-chain amino acid ABC transporter permease [Rhodospirillaceae bacterium]|nr:branched-chain amino acid ABC transporter permease [Rhodospirillaceae bacterium]MAX64294.1 branched-chain amino acid ABC transporter permease [Rhodospirillaceae bacterium]MBB58208.1 branched-chain amino acid ABC transporter permease [Rhodospirillaceae bacterium]|tara:strand:- start:6063 stop:7010 length:948 start_codon:yes stop_codon:yes gene_type:complete